MAGGIAAPLLAGFSLTTVAQLVIGKDHPWLSEWAIALFAIASASLVYAMQFSATALGYAATPAERLDYNPEAAKDEDILRKVRRLQWEEMALRAKYTKRVKHCYNLGLITFLGGLGLILIPQHWPSPSRIVAIAVVGISIAIEVMWTLSDARRPKWLLPSSSSVEPDELESQGANYLFPAEGTEGIAQSLRRCVELLEQMAAGRPGGRS